MLESRYLSFQHLRQPCVWGRALRLGGGLVARTSTVRAGARYPRHDTERPSPDNGLTVPDSAGTDQKISPQQILDNQARRYPNKRERIPHDRRWEALIKSLDLLMTIWDTLGGRWWWWWRVPRQGPAAPGTRMLQAPLNQVSLLNQLQMQDTR